MAVSDAYVFPGFLTPVLSQLFFPKPPTTFLTCFCRGERRKYAGKKVASTGDRTHNHQVMSPRRSPLKISKVMVCISFESSAFDETANRDLHYLYSPICSFHGRHLDWQTFADMASDLDLFSSVLTSFYLITFLQKSVFSTKSFHIN